MAYGLLVPAAPGARKVTCRFAILLLLIILTPEVRASSIYSQEDHSQESTPRFETPVGVGTELGDVAGHTDYGVAIEAQNHFKQHTDSTGLNRYGQAESRLNLGNGIGVSLYAMSGVTLYGISPERPRFSPHLGLEPFNGGITWNSNGHQNNFYEWIPAVSAGVQWTSGRCKYLPLIRGGGALGTVGKPGWTWSPSAGTSYGAGAYVNCLNLDVGMDATHIDSQDRRANLGVIDAAYIFSPNGLKIGVRGEREVIQQDQSETRILLVLRSRLVD